MSDATTDPKARLTHDQVLEAGRPSCPFCGNPVDPEGHLCVRANGFRRRDP